MTARERLRLEADLDPVHVGALLAERWPDTSISDLRSTVRVILVGRWLLQVCS